MNRIRQIAMASAVLLSLLVLPGALRGQTASALITGTVTDQSGAVVPQVNITITNQNTAMKWSAMTSSAGKYTVTALPVGVYNVTAKKQGFRSSSQAGISLSVGETAGVDFKLAVGSVTQTVTVEANPVSINTVTASQTQLIGERQISNLPLNGRNFTEFLTLNAAAVSSPGDEAGSMRQGKGTGYNINGNRSQDNNFTLDGLINTDVTLGDPAVILSQDAIQEFKEQKPAYSAAYGFSSNQINIISKSGTNQLHGTVFEFGRNDKIDATNFFANSKPELRQNQFGFVLGGPMIIPKVYNGRDKTFWLANYEGWRTIRGSISQGIVPDPLELQGNFSGSNLPAFGTTACSSALLLNQPCMPIDPTTGAPFSGNQIPSTRFSNLANQSLALNFFPAANCDPALCAGNNYRVNVPLPTRFDQQTYKLDQDFGGWGKASFRWTGSSYSTTTLGTLTPSVGQNNFIEEEQSFGGSWTYSLGSHAVNSFRVGRLEAKADQCGTAIDQAQVDAFKLTGTFQNIDNCARSAPGPIGMTNYAGVGGPVNDTTISYVPTWEFADDLSWVHGNHTFYFGFDIRTWVQTRNLAADFLGTFTYRNDLISNNGGNGVDGCLTPYCGTGNTVADFLLGYYQGSGIFQPGPFSNPKISGNENNYIERYYAPYFEDSWKARSNLTLNFGLRWDFRTIPYERNNKFFWLDGQNPNGGLCYADQSLGTNGVAPPGNGIYRYCGRRNPRASSLVPFAPRFGFAWRPFHGDKTVVRGGYGVFFASPKGREIDDSGDIYPFEVRSNFTPQTQPTAPKLTDNLFPAYTTVAPVTPENITFLAVIQGENPHNPYVQQWSLGVQRQLAPNTTLDVSYEGSKGTHLLTRTEIAQAVPPSDPAFCGATDANGNPINLNNGDCPVSVRRPYPNFTGNYIDSQWQGVSSYNAANVNLTRRTASMVMQLSYAWSKSLDDKSAAAGIGNSIAGWDGFLNNHDPKRDYGLSDYDVRSRFVANFIYQLPFGRGRRFGANMNKVVDGFLGGWQTGGIISLQKGFPFSIQGTDALGLLNTVGSVNRANQVGDPFPSGTRTLNQYFNTSAFAQPAPGYYGAMGRNTLRGPGEHVVDMNISKIIPITERVNFEIRFEGFNVFNTPQFSNPSTNLTSTTFGVIGSTRLDSRELQWGAKVIF
jgi:hypothetical protein